VGRVAQQLFHGQYLFLGSGQDPRLLLLLLLILLPFIDTPPFAIVKIHAKTTSTTSTLLTIRSEGFVRRTTTHASSLAPKLETVRETSERTLEKYIIIMSSSNSHTVSMIDFQSQGSGPTVQVPYVPNGAPRLAPLLSEPVLPSLPWQVVALLFCVLWLRNCTILSVYCILTG
jgi:hypothetical protein